MNKMDKIIFTVIVFLLGVLLFLVLFHKETSDSKIDSVYTQGKGYTPLISLEKKVEDSLSDGGSGGSAEYVGEGITRPYDVNNLQSLKNYRDSEGLKFYSGGPDALNRDIKIAELKAEVELLKGHKE